MWYDAAFYWSPRLGDEVAMRRLRVAAVSDPPVLTAEDVERLELEAKRLHEAFEARTAGMENLTAADLATLVR